jgi:RNA polymerase sigma-70 factor (ECF subfamily)
VPPEDVFQTERPLLFSIAYRMLGSASEAEDVLQDAWMRFAGVDAGEVRSPKALATTIVTRLCLDRLKAARTTREQYVGPWLPEPVLTSSEPRDRPDLVAQRAESVTLAFLVVLETLSPEERAVFLLKEVFDYGHAEIAEMLGTTAQNTRQLLHRARARITASPRPAVTASAERRAIADRFARAFYEGNVADLTRMLAADVRMWTDGGGKVTAARRPLAGREEVLNFFLGVRRVGAAAVRARRVAMAVTEVNGEPALLIFVDDVLDSVYVCAVEGDVIAALRIIRNPDKLAYIARQLRDRPATAAPVMIGSA